MNSRYLFLLGVLVVFMLGIAASAHAIPVTLSTSSGNFDGLLLEGADSPNVGVVLLHGRGGNSDSAVVRQLRTSLNNSGYTTLSIADPIPADANGNGVATDFSDYVADLYGANTVFPDMHERVQASLAYFAGLGIDQVVIAGFSLGSRFATEYVARGQRPGDLPIAGLIGVGMYGTSIDPYNISLTLDELTVPVLDVFGNMDSNAVNTAAARRAAYGGNAADYTQVQLTCPAGVVGNNCHKLSGLKGADDRPLETTVRTWIQHVAPLSVREPATGMLLLAGIVGLTLRRRPRG